MNTKLLLICVSLIFAAVLVKAQSSFNIKNIISQIDSGDHYIYSDTKKAETFYTDAQKAAQALQNDSLLARTHVGFAVLARMGGNYAQSMEYYQKALKIHQTTGNQRFIATDYHNIGALFRYAENYEEAKKYLRKGLLLRESIRDSAELSISYQQIGVVCRRMKQLDSAAYYYDKAFAISEARNEREMLVKVNGNRAALEHYRKNYQKAIDINQSDIPYLEANDKSESLSTRYNNIARAYGKLKNYPLAVEYMSKAIEIDKREGYRKKLYKHYEYRSKMKQKLGDYESALSDYRAYKKHRDTVLNLEQVQKFAEQKAAFEYQQQQFQDSLRFEAEREQLSVAAQSERRRKNLYFTTSLLLLSLTIAGWYYFKNRRQFTDLALEKRRLESELLQEKLQNTEKEAARIVAENQYRLEQKKNVLQHLEALQRLNKDGRIAKELNALALSMNIQLSEDEQRLFFETNREQYNVSFEEKLIQQFPELTKGERELCKFIRMNKSTKEIMELKGMTATAIRSMRYRIRKKMELDRAQELEQFLKQL